MSSTAALTAAGQAAHQRRWIALAILSTSLWLGVRLGPTIGAMIGFRALQGLGREAATTAHRVGR